METTNPLLSQLQRRLPALAETKTTTVGEKDALKQLIAILYHQQYNVGEVGRIAAVEATLALPLTALANAFPMLISEASPHTTTPIVLFPPFVAFHRSWQQLQQVADYLQQPQTLSPPDVGVIEQVNWALGNQQALSQEQQLAVITAASLPFCVITGGAGTGKTTTLAKALEILLLQRPDSEILLAAPTGKAAHRLNESLAAQTHTIHTAITPRFQALTATTLHRLLGISEHTGLAFYHGNNPLRCDVLAIDEASMISSTLFVQIQQAIQLHTRLILLGDANQLPAINSMALFNEISRLPIGYSEDFRQTVSRLLPELALALYPTLSTASSQTDTDKANVVLPNAICRLNVARRFAQHSMVETAATAVLQRQPDALFSALGEQFCALGNVGNDLAVHLLRYYPLDSLETLLPTLDNRIILCANRKGYFGSDNINQHLDTAFRRALQGSATGQTWYAGRRIMIEKNDYQLGVNNGDIARCQWQDGWVVHFDDGRTLSVEDLPVHSYSLAFAISIHKSQGSEYPHVDIVLDRFDADNPNPLITPSLLYTAITRAKQSVCLYADRELIDHVLSEQAAIQPTLASLLGAYND